MADDIADQILELVQLMRADVSALGDQVSAISADIWRLGQQMALIAETYARHAPEMASVGVASTPSRDVRN